MWVLVVPGARRRIDRVGRVGDVDDPQLAAADVDVLGLRSGVAGDRVDPDQGEAAGARSPCAARRSSSPRSRTGPAADPDRRRVGGVGDVPHPDRVHAAGHEVRRRPQEAAGDRGLAGVGREVLDVAAEQRGVVALGEEVVADLDQALAVRCADAGEARAREPPSANETAARATRVRMHPQRPASRRSRGRSTAPSSAYAGCISCMVCESRSSRVAACAAASASFSCVRRRTSASSSATRARSRVFSAVSRAGIRRSLFM